MSGEVTKLAVVGLTRPEALDLQRALKEANAGEVEVEEPPVDETSAGVLVESVVVVTLGAMAISGLTAWLLKNRKKTKITQRVVIRRANGDVEERELEIRQNEAVTGEFVEGVVKSMQRSASE